MPSNSLSLRHERSHPGDRTAIEFRVLVAAARLLDFSQNSQRDLSSVLAFGVGSYEDMGRFLQQSMMAVAELEAGMISARTKAALAASKARGKQLGGFRGRAGTAEDTARARAARGR